MELVFKEETHQYFLGDKELISVTTLMKKHGLSPNYSNVPSEVLRAKAERGSLIHKEIEDYIKEGTIGFTTELAEFIKAKKGEVLNSEFRVHNDIVAGTVDLLLYDSGYIIADLKTTYTLHKEPISWQLSIYAYLIHEVNPTVNITRGQAYHFDKDGNLNIVEIELKPFIEVKRLLDAERNGEVFKQEVAVNNADLIKLVEVESLIKNIEDQKKQAEAQAQELRAGIMAAMEKTGVKTFENDRIKLTYVEPTTRTSIDSAKLKKEMPQIAEKYTKTSNIKASLRITLKEE